MVQESKDQMKLIIFTDGASRGKICNEVDEPIKPPPVNKLVINGANTKVNIVPVIEIPKSEAKATLIWAKNFLLSVRSDSNITG